MNVRNCLHLTGNLGSAPSTIVLKTGVTATTFNLATNEYFRDKDGKRQTRTEWHRVKAYGKLAELFAKYLDKGSQISLVGSLRYRRWTDKFEQTRVTCEVIAEEFTFLDKLRSTPETEATEEPTAAEDHQPRRRTKRGKVTELAA